MRFSMKNIDFRTQDAQRLRNDIRNFFVIGDAPSAIQLTQDFFSQANVFVPNQYKGAFWGQFRAACAQRDQDAIDTLIKLCISRDPAVPLRLSGMNSVATETVEFIPTFSPSTEPS